MKIIKVLVVDDENLIRRNIISKIKRMQHSVKYEIYEAGNVTQAQQSFDEIQPDVVITDVCMPKKSGMQFVKYIRGTGSSCRIIVLSGYDDFSYVREGFLLGIDDYLLKPLSFSELDEMLRRYCCAKKGEKKEEEDIGPKVEIYGKMKLAMEFINEKYMQNPSMQECADYSGMSYSYFSKVFKDTFHVTYSQYVNDKRMNAAKEMLENPTCKIGDVARKMGFENQNHFSRAFYRTFGMYPSDYRKKNEENYDGQDSYD